MAVVSLFRGTKLAVVTLSSKPRVDFSEPMKSDY